MAMERIAMPDAITIRPANCSCGGRIVPGSANASHSVATQASKLPAISTASEERSRFSAAPVRRLNTTTPSITIHTKNAARAMSRMSVMGATYKFW